MPSKIIVFCFLSSLLGCAHHSNVIDLGGQLPAEALKEACDIGGTLLAAKGSIWLDFDFPNKKGRFPALLKIEDIKKSDFEITNLLGGTEAKVHIESDLISVVKPPTFKPELYRGKLWSGVPIDWINGLMLGKVPCPAANAMVDVEHGRIRAEDKKGVWYFRLTKIENRWWPAEIEWLPSLKKSVKLKLGKPEDATRAPLYWQALTVGFKESGTFTFRWNKRETNLSL